LAFAIILAAVIVPLVREEFNIAKMTTPPVRISDIEAIYVSLCAQFKLSVREGEILRLLARGHSAGNIAKSLIISPYTVNTHVQHIYEKLGIHKRAELIDIIEQYTQGEVR
jgi:DNA-binding CsgD family transcriptional regulator